MVEGETRYKNRGNLHEETGHGRKVSRGRVDIGFQPRSESLRLKVPRLSETVSYFPSCALIEFDTEGRGEFFSTSDREEDAPRWRRT